MELLTCPACGCSVQVADAVLGQRVRCFGCQHSFVATARRSAPPAQQEKPALPRFAPPPHSDDEEATANQGSPFCPGCGRRIRWKDFSCPYCGEELEAEDGPRPGWRRAIDPIRRDYEPHRGTLILSLGNISTIAGGLSLCLLGLGAIVSVPLGIFTWLIANRDLERMREGRMDPRGKAQTESGRTAAVAGVFLGLIIAAFYAIIYLAG